MTKPWETTDFEAVDFVNVVEKYIWKDVIDYVIVNNGYISEEMADKYKSLECKKPVKVKSYKYFRAKWYKVIEADLLHEHTCVRHSYDKIASVLDNLIRKIVR